MGGVCVVGALLGGLVLDFILVFTADVGVKTGMIDCPMPRARPLSSSCAIRIGNVAVPMCATDARRRSGGCSVTCFSFSNAMAVAMGDGFRLDGLGVLPSGCNVHPSMGGGVTAFGLSAPYSVSFRPSNYGDPLVLFDGRLRGDVPSGSSPGMVCCNPNRRGPGGKLVGLASGRALCVTKNTMIGTKVRTANSGVAVYNHNVLSNSS